MSIGPDTIHVSNERNTMQQLLKTWFLIPILVVATCAAVMADKPTASRCYLIGNSLSWDTVPPLLSGDVQ